MFGDSMRALVDIATTLSFLIAPFIALFNLRLVHIPYLDPEHEPSRRMRYLGYLGLVYLTGFSVLFLLS
jgi:Mn2+/Fe2+ NRAMP family transporter